MISSVFPRYSYVLGSYPIGENQVIKNLSDQKVFISGLTIEVFDKVLMRLFQPDWGWSQTEYWREAYPSLRLNNGNGYLGKLINQAKLCVITYNATTFLEVLSQNIPTIAFWDPGNWELREEAIQLFDGLRRAGILWSNPMDAAEKVNQIWGDVEKWWLQPLIQEARLAFCSKYAKRPNDMIKDCKKSLLAAKGFRS